VRIVVAGGSGFLGGALTGSLRAKGHSVIVLTRRARRDGDVAWGSHIDPHLWSGHVRDADAVVNLAGESIAGGRWTASRKATLRSSRLSATQALVREILAAPHPPAFLSASGIGFYGTRGDTALTEASPAGHDFLATLCRDWERAAVAASGATRVVMLRTGVVLDRTGGALPQLARPFQFFAGGPVGSGRQFVSWIHLDDWVAMTEWAISSAAVTGPLNLTAPHPVTNAELARALGAALHRPAFVRAPAIAVRLVAGEMADAAILNGQRVLPSKAAALGFTFRYPVIDEALRAVYGAT
jgi:uncharacterized protein (TIGR01777 family)